MALASDGSLFTWGDGSRGQLGHSQLQSLAAMMPANNPITMPTAQKITRLDPISLSPEHRVTAIAAGAAFSMALTVGGSILAFGANEQGQLGTGDNADRWKPTRINLNHRVVPAAAAAVQQLQRESEGSGEDEEDDGSGEDEICEGKGDVDEILAQLAAPTSSQRRDDIYAGGSGGGGSGSASGQCLRVVQLACGQAHSVALLSCQGRLQVRTTGANSHGQLGHGDRLPRTVFTPLPRLPNVVAVQAGDEHSSAVSANGDLFLWGRGDCGQLGLGDGRAKWKPTLLRGYKVVHPDKTLRRNKRNQPYTRTATGEARLASHAGAPFM
jgi:alpha-tubulin suppressor-like RCC1 family protein